MSSKILKATAIIVEGQIERALEDLINGIIKDISDMDISNAMILVELENCASEMETIKKNLLTEMGNVKFK